MKQMEQHDGGSRLRDVLLSVIEWDLIMGQMAGTVAWLMYLYPSVTDYTKKLYATILDGSRRVEQGAKFWLLSM